MIGENTLLGESSVDLTKVPPIQHERTKAFFNHFIVRTATFLNHFASRCDAQFEVLSGQLEKLEVSLAILEAKLASISNLPESVIRGDQQVSVQSATPVVTSASSVPPPPPPPPPMPQVSSTPAAAVVSSLPPQTTVIGTTPATTAISSSSTTVETQQSESNDGADDGAVAGEALSSNLISQDSRYAKYFKMVKLGIPHAAVQIKMRSEGVDPELLNNPDAPAPPLIKSN